MASVRLLQLLGYCMDGRNGKVMGECMAEQGLAGQGCPVLVFNFYIVSLLGLGLGHAGRVVV